MSEGNAIVLEEYLAQLTDEEKETQDRNYRILQVMKTIAYSVNALYEVLADKNVQTMLFTDLKGPISDKITSAMKNVMDKIQFVFDAVGKVQKRETLEKLNTLLDASCEMAGASVELLDDDAKTEAKKSVAKLTVILGLVKVGLPYVFASINLLNLIGIALTGKLDTTKTEHKPTKETTDTLAILKAELDPLWKARNERYQLILALRDEQRLNQAREAVGLPRLPPPAPAKAPEPPT